MLYRISLAVLLIGLVSASMAQAPIPTGLGYQVPDAVLYESFFHRVVFLDNIVIREASPRGWDVLPPKDRIQRAAGISNAEMATLLAVARDWQAKSAANRQLATQSMATARSQAQASGAPSLAVSLQLKDLQSKREALALNGVAQLRTTLGSRRFGLLDAYVRRTSKLVLLSTPPPAPARP